MVSDNCNSAPSPKKIATSVTETSGGSGVLATGSAPIGPEEMASKPSMALPTHDENETVPAIATASTSHAATATATA
jgi:hypothetical protein